MPWYQPEDFNVVFVDKDGHKSNGFLSFGNKLKLFLWNRLLPEGVRLRLIGSRFDRWVMRG